MVYRGHIQNGVAVLDEPAQLPDGTAVRIEVDTVRQAFWENKSVADLVREQGIKPFSGTEELAGEWPREVLIDEFLAFIREGRR